MKLVIVIEGESAKDLFAVGPKDLKEYFIPEGLPVKSEDITHCNFTELVPGKVPFVDKDWGIEHKDNF